MCNKQRYETPASAIPLTIIIIIIIIIVVVVVVVVYFLWLCSPARTMVSSFTMFLDHTQRRLISSSQRTVTDNTQQTKHTKIHVPGWIRTHDRSR
jgi:flagellar basal body-associated protein FliL